MLSLSFAAQASGLVGSGHVAQMYTSHFDFSLAFRYCTGCTVKLFVEWVVNVLHDVLRRAFPSPSLPLQLSDLSPDSNFRNRAVELMFASGQLYHGRGEYLDALR